MKQKARNPKSAGPRRFGFRVFPFLRISGFGFLVSAAAAGCVSQAQRDAQQAVNDYAVGNYGEAARLLAPLAKDTNEDFVLNNCRLGSATVAEFDLQASQAAFLRAYEVLNSYGVNNGGRTLGAVMVSESLKVWRGEPFDRAMANFYLGLTYYMQADYANARGAFENALFKLRDYDAAPQDADGKAAADAYRDVDSNFVLGQYLLARCYQRLGNDDQATAMFAQVGKYRPGMATLSDPGRNKRSNVLVVIDYGDGPRKATNGEGSFVGFVPTPREAGGVPRPAVLVDGRYADTAGADAPLVDTLALAQDHRWQSIDTIHTVKSLLGTGLIGAGAITTLDARNRNTAYVGLGLLAAGVLLKATSVADLRVWETLPRSTFAIPLTLPPGPHDLTVEFPAFGLRQTIRGAVAPAAGDATYYVRVRGYGGTDVAWPPPTLTGWPEPPTPNDPPQPRAPAPPVPTGPPAAPNPPTDLPAPP